MVIYQYMSYSCYREIHLLRFISYYCTLIYNKYGNLLGFICPSSQNSTYLTNNHHKTLLITQISNKSLLWYFQRPFSATDNESTTFSKASTVQTQPKKRRPHRANIERRGSIVGCPIMRAITTIERCYCITSIRLTIHIVTKSYQYLSHFIYCERHMLR